MAFRSCGPPLRAHAKWTVPSLGQATVILQVREDDVVVEAVVGAVAVVDGVVATVVVDA